MAPANGLRRTLMTNRGTGPSSVNSALNEVGFWGMDRWGTQSRMLDRKGFHPDLRCVAVSP